MVCLQYLSDDLMAVQIFKKVVALFLTMLLNPTYPQKSFLYLGILNIYIPLYRGYCYPIYV